ncbi:MAG TPA: DUF1730 domain-containing protein [Clostridiales bacterium]|nr:DUF1730 domain-containing protein [Clostridiales bacterium]
MTSKELFEILPHGVCRFSDFENHLIDCRNKNLIPENAKSIIVYLFPYYLGEENYKNRNISRYAVPRDYHSVAGELLDDFCEILNEKYPNDEFVPFLDNSPIPEVSAAIACSLGVRGKNRLLINDDYGSYCFIGEIVTTKEYEYSSPEKTVCENCGLCEKACPVNAINNGKIDAEKCMSAITQQKKELTDEQQKIIKDSGICWGCDICQEACPKNKKPKITPINAFIESAIPNIDENTTLENRAFAWRGEKVIRRNIEIIKK